MSIVLKNKTFLAILLFVLSAAIRLHGIGSFPLQSDESHWLSRSDKVIHQLRKNPTHATDHLGHPGVPPAVIMAFGQWSAEKYNNFRNLTAKDPNFIDGYSACRIANALFSSLIGPILIFGLTPFIGLLPTLLAAILFSLDPNSLFLTRLAHIDGILTVLVSLTIIFYLKALQKQSTYLKILAGMIWGLCIATKPTALALIPAFLFIKAILITTNLKGEKSTREKILDWGDLWAVVSGHIMLAAIYTRFWHHPSEYVFLLHISNSFADLIYNFGISLSKRPIVSILGLMSFITSTFIFWKRYKNRNQQRDYHLAQASLLLSIILIPLIFAPRILENIVFYWIRVFSLSSIEHDGFTGNTLPHPAGYLGLLFSLLPPIIIIGLVFYLFFLLKNFKLEILSAQTPIHILLLGIILVWIFPLAISAKQSFRYILPILPFIYVLSSIGLLYFANWVTSIFLNFSKSNPKTIKATIFTICILTASYNAYSLAPHYELYLNSLGGSYKEAINRGQIRPLLGIHEALRFLKENAPTKNGKITISVIGDGDVLNEMMKREHPEVASRFTFGYFPPFVADYLFTMFGIPLPSGSFWNATIKNDPVFNYKHNNLTVTQVLKVPIFDFSDKVTILVSSQPRETGKVRSSKNRSIYVSTKKHSKGHLLYALYPYKMPSGTYVLSFPLSIFSKKEDSKKGDIVSDYGDKTAATISFGKECSKIVRANELSVNAPTDIILKCTFLKQAGAIPRVYWHGAVPITLGDFTIKKIPSNKNSIMTDQRVTLLSR